MGVFETFAKRQLRLANSRQPEVYQYEEVPAFLRKQVSLIFDAALGVHNDVWGILCTIMEREYEGFPGTSRDGSRNRCIAFIRNEADVSQWLSLVELVCRYLTRRSDGGEQAYSIHASQEADDALKEINDRFRESAFGYQFENDEIIRIDSQFVHAEIVKPVLALLMAEDFEKANEDFMTAHRHYRAGENKDAIVAANRAFESALKAICKARQWEYPDGARASELMKVVRAEGLFPDYLDKGLDTYVAMIRTGLPGVRNSAGGHGEAPETPTVPAYMASYAIHLTASNILLVMNAHREAKARS